MPQGANVELRVWAKLALTSPAVKCGVKAVVAKPNSYQITGVNDMTTKQDPGQELGFDLVFDGGGFTRETGIKVVEKGGIPIPV